MVGYDPYRLGYRPEPLGVAGPLPPPLRLVEEDDLLHHDRPRVHRVLAIGIAALFVAATALTTVLSLGSYSLVVDAGSPKTLEPTGGDQLPSRTPKNRGMTTSTAP